MSVGRFKKNGQYYDISAAGVYDTGLQKSQAQINAAQDAEIANVKSAVTEMIVGEKTDATLWSKGGLASGGNYSAYAGALSTRRIGYPEFVKCHTKSGYYINVGAFDSNNNYLGKYTPSGTWGQSPANITEFNFSQFPDYSFVVTLFNGAETINLSEYVNCIFETNYDTSVVPAIDSTGGFTELLASGSITGGGYLWHYPVDIKAGDVIVARQQNTNNLDYFSMALRNNGQTIVTLWDVGKKTIVGKSARVVMQDNADEVLVFCNKPTVFEVRRVHSTVYPYDNELEKDVPETGGADFLTAQILGENAIAENSKFIPEQTVKMFLLDNSYKYFSAVQLKRIIDQMYAHGLNYLALGFAGGGLGISFKLNDMTIESYGKTYDLSDCVITGSGKYLTESDMEDIISYAASKQVEIVPYVGMPGHFTVFLNKYPQFGYRNKSSDAWKSLNVDDPMARDFAYQVAEMYLKWFARHGCKYWVTGTDEFDYPRSGYSNLQTAGNYNYALFINELLLRIAKYRIIPLAWNDPFCINRSFYPFMNRTVPILYWSNVTNGRAPATMISSNGNPLINSSEDIYYVENKTVPTQSTFNAFNVHNFADGSTIQNPIGACFCAWIGTRENPPLDDDGAAITDKLLPCIGYFGDSIASQLN